MDLLIWDVFYHKINLYFFYLILKGAEANLYTFSLPSTSKSIQISFRTLYYCYDTSISKCGEIWRLHHFFLQAKLAKYRSQLLEPSGKGGEKGEGFDVMKSGDARVAMIGFPSVGKSTLLSTLTKTESCVASYEFTTLTCIPGVIDYKGKTRVGNGYFVNHLRTIG